MICHPSLYDFAVYRSCQQDLSHKCIGSFSLQKTFQPVTPFGGLFESSHIIGVVSILISRRRLSPYLISLLRILLMRTEDTASSVYLI